MDAFSPPGHEPPYRFPKTGALAFLTLWGLQLALTVALYTLVDVFWVPVGGPAVAALLWGIAAGRHDPNYEPGDVLHWAAGITAAIVILGGAVHGVCAGLGFGFLYFALTAGGIALGLAVAPAR